MNALIKKWTLGIFKIRPYLSIEKPGRDEGNITIRITPSIIRIDRKDHRTYYGGEAMSPRGLLIGFAGSMGAGILFGHKPGEITGLILLILALWNFFYYLKNLIRSSGGR